MKRTLVIGDIHGGLKALKQVLERANVQEDDHLIFLGDYVDGWSESAQLIEFLMDLSKKMQCDFIYGNHDAWCFDWLTSGTKNYIWLEHGGQETVESYQRIQEGLWYRHLKFFREMHNYIIDDQNRLFIHAGFSSMHGPEQEHYSSNYNWDRTLWEMAMSMHGRIQPSNPHYPKRLKLFKEIYIGHTPVTNWDQTEPWNRANVWNIDTGAAFHGRLSILDIDTKEFWQSDPVWTLYPDETGRNK